MKIAVLQYPIVWADVQTNVRNAAERIAALANKADVAMLPEMFSTGFCVERPELAEPVDGFTITTLQHTANTSGVAIAGSFICKQNGQLFNRGFFLRPNDTPTFVDKRHLYAHGHEDTFFTAANPTRTVFSYQGVKMLMLICYDLRFPVWARNVNGDDYDILLVCANWPEARIQFWDTLVAARAVENQSYIVAANMIGEDDKGLHYCGHSVAYDTRLHELLHFAHDEQGTRIADLSIPALHHFRQTLPLWKDADNELIHPF